LAFAFLALVFGGKKISVNRRRKNDEAMSMTLGFAITFASLIRMGPEVSVPISMLSCLSSCVYPKLQKPHQMGFNLGLSAIEASVAGMAFCALNGWSLDVDPSRTLIAIAISSLFFFLVNTFGVAVMISLCTGEKVVPTWRESFSWTAPSYFASASMGALAMMLFHGSAIAILLLILPIGFFVYQAYGTHLARNEDKQAHIEQLELKRTELADLYLATIESLALAIDAKDQYTHQHIIRVQRYAVALASAMGLEGDDLQGVKTGALLHDIGKLGVPEYVLLKPGPLTAEEFDKVKKHPEIGAAILDPVVFPWPVLPAVRHHHEKWDGTGYPDGLKGEGIPLIARIMAVADVYDALTSTRSYRGAKTHEQAIAIITKDSNRHFDPAVVDVFLTIIDGVVQEMATEGIGPLAGTVAAPIKAEESRSAEVARHISRASTELWALFEVTQSLSSGLGLKETAELVVRKIAEIYTDASCSFLLWNPNAESLVVDSVFGINKEYFIGARTSGPDSPSVQTITTKKSYFGAFDTRDLVFSQGILTPFTPLNKALIVPVVLEGKLLGTINVYHPSADALTEYDRQLLELVAERSASAIYNGMLFDRTKGDSLRDHLTGVHNLRYMLGYLDRLAGVGSNSKEAPGEFSLLYLDLDSFKPINDGFGHSKGDAVLRDLASTLLDIVGNLGTVCRCGGDEFAVVLPAFSSDAAKDLAKRLQNAIDHYDPGLRHPTLGSIRVGVSIGEAHFPSDAQDPAALIAAADLRMYAQKTERKLLQLVNHNEPAPVSSISPAPMDGTKSAQPSEAPHPVLFNHPIEATQPGGSLATIR